MLRWRQPIVGVEAEVAISPVQRPAPGRLDVTEPGDGKSCPLRVRVVPGWPTLDDRQMPGPDLALHADLVADMLRDALLAPAPDPRHVQFRQTCLRHRDSLSTDVRRTPAHAARAVADPGNPRRAAAADTPPAHSSRVTSGTATLNGTSTISSQLSSTAGREAQTSTVNPAWPVCRPVRRNSRPGAAAPHRPFTWPRKLAARSVPQLSATT